MNVMMHKDTRKWSKQLTLRHKIYDRAANAGEIVPLVRIMVSVVATVSTDAVRSNLNSIHRITPSNRNIEVDVTSTYFMHLKEQM